MSCRAYRSLSPQHTANSIWQNASCFDLLTSSCDAELFSQRLIWAFIINFKYVKYYIFILQAPSHQIEVLIHLVTRCLWRYPPISACLYFLSFMVLESPT